MSKWQKVKLGGIVHNLDSRRIPLNNIERSKKELNGKYPYVGANNIMGYINEYIFDEKVLCVAEDGGSWGKNQKCAVIINEKCWVNNHAHVLTPKDNVSLEFLMRYLNYEDLNSYITGTTRGKLTKSALSSIEIPLPSLSVQLKIATILDKADALRQKDKQLLAKYDELAQAVFYDLFGDPVSNEKGWEVKNLESAYINPKEGTKCGPFGSALKKEEYVSAGIPVWTMYNIANYKFSKEGCLYITEEKFKELSAYMAEPGDIIISRAGTVGKMCELKMDFQKSIIHSNIIRLRLNQKVLRPVVFISVMQYFGDKVMRLKKGNDGAFTHMSTGVLDDISFPFPPIELQSQFAAVIEKIEQQKLQAQEQLQMSEELFQSLLQKAFNGELVK